jgi:hypothetical protein
VKFGFLLNSKRALLCKFAMLLALSMMLLISLAAQQATFSAEPHAELPAPPEGYHFPTGAVLHYDAEWRLWKAGTGALHLEQNNDVAHVWATAEASGAVALLFHVQDRFDSWFDAHTGCSTRILKHTEEGLHNRETNLTFDATHGRSVLDERNLRSGETKHLEGDAPACVTDVLSGIYYLASQRLDPGYSYLLPVNDGGKNFAATAYVEGREEVKTSAGNFHTVRVAIFSDRGPLKGRGKVWIWYTDDAQHLPVQMRSRLFWGTLTIRLTRLQK